MTEPTEFDRLVNDLCEEIMIEPGTAEAVVASAWLAGLRRELLDVTAQRDRWKSHYDAQDAESESASRAWGVERAAKRATIQRWRDRAEAAEGALVAARTENERLRATLQAFNDGPESTAFERSFAEPAGLAVARRDAATAALDEVERLVKFEAGPGDVYMRADVLSVIAQVRRGRASMLASPEPPTDEIPECVDCGAVAVGVDMDGDEVCDEHGLYRRWPVGATPEKPTP